MNAIFLCVSVYILGCTRQALLQTAANTGTATEEQARRMDGAFLSIGCLCDLLKRKVLPPPPSPLLTFVCCRM